MVCNRKLKKNQKSIWAAVKQIMRRDYDPAEDGEAYQEDEETQDVLLSSNGGTGVVGGSVVERRQRGLLRGGVSSLSIEDESLLVVDDQESLLAFRLFDTGSRRDVILNYLMGSITVLSVTVTLALSILRAVTTNSIHIFMGMAVFSVAGTNVILIRWYQRGDLDPRFRKVIGYAAVSVLVLCVAANVYFWRTPAESPLDCRGGGADGGGSGADGKIWCLNQFSNTCVVCGVK